MATGEISFKQNVKKSFSVIKTDVVNLKRRTNQHSLIADELVDRVQSCIPKEEFYKFIKKLADRLDKIEGMREWKRSEKEKEEIHYKFKELDKRAKIKENLKSEVRQVRKLQAKVAMLEGNSVKISDHNREVTNLVKDVSAARKAMITDKEYHNTKGVLADLNKRTNDMLVSFVNNDVFEEKIQELKEMQEDIREAAKSFAMKEKVLENHHTKRELKQIFEDFEMLKKGLLRTDEELKKSEDKFLGKIEEMEEAIERKMNKMFKETKKQLDDLDKKQNKEAVSVEKKMDRMMDRVEAGFKRQEEARQRIREREMVQPLKASSKKSSKGKRKNSKKSIIEGIQEFFTEGDSKEEEKSEKSDK